MVTSGHNVDADRDLIGKDTSSHDCLGLGLLEDGVGVSIIDHCHHEAATTVCVSRYKFSKIEVWFT